jgi:type IV pilus assembly protein PilV
LLNFIKLSSNSTSEQMATMQQQGNGTLSRKNGAHGFTLIEVLVAVVVLSLGILGMVGMQAAALKSNKEARFQSLGVQYAREFADMVRGNSQVGALQTSNPYIGQFQTGSGATTSLATANPSYCLSPYRTAACADNSEVARAELTDVLTRAANDLPGARIDTCFDSAPYDANGKPQWTCTAPTAAAPGLFTIKVGWTRSVLDKSATGDAAYDRATTPAVVITLQP